MSATLLKEMASYDEKEVFSMKPVVSVSTEKVLNLEGKDFKDYVLNAIKAIETPYLTNAQSIGEIYSHHCVGRNKRKAAMTALPVILNNALVVKPWRTGHNKHHKTGMIAAPILIDGERYLCGVTLKKNLANVITPMAITLKDGNMNVVEEKIIDNISVHDNSSDNSAFGNNHYGDAVTSQDANHPFFGAKVQHNSKLTKRGERNDVENNENKQYNMKQTIRLTEGDLHRIIRNCVNEALDSGIPDDTANIIWNIERKIDFNTIRKYLRELCLYLNDTQNRCGGLKGSVINCLNKGLCLYEHIGAFQESLKALRKQ